MIEISILTLVIIGIISFIFIYFKERKIYPKSSLSKNLKINLWMILFTIISIPLLVGILFLNVLKDTIIKIPENTLVFADTPHGQIIYYALAGILAIYLVFGVFVSLGFRLSTKKINPTKLKKDLISHTKTLSIMILLFLPFFYFSFNSYYYATKDSFYYSPFFSLNKKSINFEKLKKIEKGITYEITSGGPRSPGILYTVEDVSVYLTYNLIFENGEKFSFSKASKTELTELDKILRDKNISISYVKTEQKAIEYAERKFSQREFESLKQILSDCEKCNF